MWATAGLAPCAPHPQHHSQQAYIIHAAVFLTMTQAASPLLHAPLQCPLPADLPPLLPLLGGLVRSRVLTGYALLSVQGVVDEVVGPLRADLTTQVAPGLPPAALQFLQPFTVCDTGVTHFVVAGSKLLVVLQEPGYLLALGPRRAVCLAVFQLQQGIVLVATWDRSTPPQSALQLLDKLVAPFRV